jgi:hypothetical protein
MTKLSIFAALFLLPIPLLAETTSEFHSSGPIFTCFGEGVIKSGYDTVDGELVFQSDANPEQRAPIFGFEIVPAEIGIGFGFYACSIAPQLPITLIGTATHPPMEFSGRTTTRQSWPIMLSAQRGVREGEEVCLFVGYKLEDAFELVLGDWVFSLWENEKLLLSETFELVERNEFPFYCN